MSNVRINGVTHAEHNLLTQRTRCMERYYVVAATKYKSYPLAEVVGAEVDCMACIARGESTPWVDSLLDDIREVTDNSVSEIQEAVDEAALDSMMDAIVAIEGIKQVREGLRR